MKQYINKDALVAEIERELKSINNATNDFAEGRRMELNNLLSFLDTLEVKEVYEYNDVNLNPLFEEMGVEPDSRIALMFKNAFYKSVDNYLGKKENKL